MPTDNGYSNQKKKGTAQFETVHDLGSGRHGKSVTTKALYDVAAAAGLVSITPVLNSNGLIEFYNLEITAHGLTSNNLGVVKFTSGALQGWEIPVERIISANNLYVLPIFDTVPSPGDLVKSMGWVTSKADSEGNLNFSPGPTQFVLDGLSQQVVQDTTTAANNRALPNLPFFYKDGEQTPVSVDTITPTNSTPLPVEIFSMSGPINVTAGDLNVQLSDIGANFDAARIGDGTGNYLDIAVHETPAKADGIQVQGERMDDATLLSTSSRGAEGDALRVLTDAYGQVRTYDQFSLEELALFRTNFNTRTPASLGRKAAASSFATVLSSEDFTVLSSIDTRLSGNLSVSDAQVLAELQAIDAKIPANLTVSSTRLLVDGSGVTQPISAASLPLPTGAATEAKQDAEAILIGATAEVAPATDTAVSGLNGRLQRIAQRITSLIGLLPTSLGQKTMANSLAVTLASDQSALSVTQTALTASYQEDLTVNNTPETITAPAGAKWCKIQADGSNTGNLRVKVGGAAASTTSGIVLEPGRSEDFMAAGNISYCSTDNTGTDKIYVQFGA